jgi:hypothetical protein
MEQYMYPKLNETIGQTLSGMTGLLFPVAPEDRKANGPSLTGFLEKRIKMGDEYKTVTRLEVAGFPAEGNGKKYVRLQIAGGLATATLFKNEEPKGENPPASSGSVGGKEDGGNLKIAAYNQEVNGKKAFRLSIYEAKSSSSTSGTKSGKKAADPLPPAMDDDIPF